MSDDPRITKPTITTTLRQDWHSVDACKPLRNPMAELRSENDVLRAENERLRRENAGLRGGYVNLPTCDPDTVLRMPVAKFRLTDAEREAIAEMALVCEGREKRSLEWQLPEEAVHWRGMAETLRGLLAARSETANV